MIAKLIVHDATRESAIKRMRQALAETVILGTITNIDFLQVILQHPAFVDGKVDTEFVDDNLNLLLPDVPELPHVALIAAALAEMAGQPQTSITANGTAGGDIYSPWQRNDNFRIGD